MKLKPGSGRLLCHPARKWIRLMGLVRGNINTNKNTVWWHCTKSLKWHSTALQDNEKLSDRLPIICDN